MRCDMKLRFDVCTKDAKTAANAFYELSGLCEDAITLTRNKHWSDREQYHYNLFGSVDYYNTDALVNIMSDNFVDDSDDLS